MVYMKQEKWGFAKDNLIIAVNKPTPEGATYMNPMTYHRDAYVALAVCQLNLGKLDDALSAIQQAYKADKDSKPVIETYNLVNRTREKSEAAKNFVKIASYLRNTGNEKKILPLLSGVPNELADDVMILKVLYDYNPPARWENKSLAVYCPNTAEPFNPRIVAEEGRGGSEIAVVEITKRLAAKGIDVVVYANCQVPPEGEDFDGVRWMNYWTFNWKDEFDALWVWRAPELFDLDLQARYSLVDLHDVMNPLDFSEERLERIGKLFVKSKYHRSLFPSVPDDKFEIVGNGIGLEKFKQDVPERSPNRFVYASTPDRGLDILLEFIWPKIREEIPDAELHVYYGWKTFYELQKHNPERMQWLDKVRSLMKQPGVVDHGRVSQEDLAAGELQSSMWLYPTDFPEIHCMTACEMQAAGVIPITSGYAALEETVKHGITIPGDIYDPAYHEEFAKQVIDLYNNKGRQEDLRTQAIQAADQFSWDIVADSWYNKIYG